MNRRSTKHFSDYFRTSLDVLHVQSHSENVEMNLQGAFYNVAAFVFVSLGLGAAVAAYFVLEAFIKPLLWASLCGAFLYPFKKTLSRSVRSWLRSLSDSSTPLVLGVILIPFGLLNQSSAIVGSLVFGHFLELLSLITVSLLLYLLYIYQPFYEIFLALNSAGLFLYNTIDYFRNPFWVWSLVISYLLILIFFWTPSYSRTITTLAYPVWIVFLLHLASIAGNLRVPLFLFVSGLFITGLLADLIKSYKGYKAPKNQNRFVRSLSVAAAAALNDNLTESEASEEDLTFSTKKTESDDHIEKVKETSATTTDHDSESEENGKTERPQLTKHKAITEEETVEKRPMKQSNIFFLALFWAIGLVCIAKNVWIIQLLTIPSLIYLIKMVLVYTGVDLVLYQLFENMKTSIKEWAEERKDVLAPAPVRALMRTALLGDNKMVLWIEQFMDKLISIFMILCLILGTVVFGVVMAVQVQRESMHLAKVTGDVVNDAITHYPEFFKHWLPEKQDFRDIVQSTLDQAYVHARKWLANKIQDLGTGNNINNTQIQNDILELTDRLYHSWRQESNSSLLEELSDSSNNSLRKNNASFGLSVNNAFKWVTNLKGIDLNAVLAVVKENIGTLLSVLESIWAIFKSNMTLAFNIVTASLSLVFSSGTYLLNVGFSIIVFLTALFYLLSFSQDQYLPVSWVSTLSGSGSLPFGEAIFTAIRGVFGASLKMAVFYGLYTWLTHTLFGVKIVFIPAAIAAVTGVVPFVASYWAAIPAVLELWLIDEKEIKAILLVICHVLPTYVVDTVIYSEIRGGGHPYLTGLAVAGGIYCIGLEGAIVGPIVLCCVVAAFNVYKIIMQGQESTAPIPNIF